jgi:hypothetical protein
VNLIQRRIALNLPDLAHLQRVKFRHAIESCLADSVSTARRHAGSRFRIAHHSIEVPMLYVTVEAPTSRELDIASDELADHCTSSVALLRKPSAQPSVAASLKDYTSRRRMKIGGIVLLGVCALSAAVGAAGAVLRGFEYDCVRWEERVFWWRSCVAYVPRSHVPSTTLMAVGFSLAGASLIGGVTLLAVRKALINSAGRKTSQFPVFGVAADTGGGTVSAQWWF